ncbi:MAG: tetratricopeptide repeat protein [Candidatus Hermodarchaeota archaeon]
MSDIEADVEDAVSNYLSTLKSVKTTDASSRFFWEMLKGISLCDNSVVYGLDSLISEPNTPTFWNAFAVVHMMNDDLPSAEAAIVRSLDLDTSVPSTWRIWGQLHLLRGDDMEAERSFRMSLELDPDNKRTMRQLVGLFRVRGAYPEAIDLLTTLLEDFPNDQGLWNLLTDCMNLEGKG